MEFKEFRKERDRMCSAEQSKCKIHSKVMNCMNCDSYCFANPDEAERIVSDWSKENPIVTNASKFREVFGVKDGILENGALNFYSAGATVSEEWLQQEYQPPRKEETHD